MAMTARQHPSTPDLPYFPWAGFMQNPSGWSFVRQSAVAAEPVMRSAARAQLEVSSLVGTRLKAWTGVPETLSRCRTPVDLMQAQMAFWQAAVHDYTAASRQLMVAWASAMPGAFGGADGEQAADRDFITFPEAGDESEERRRPGASRRAA
jgi:hypothetical protein